MPVNCAEMKLYRLLAILFLAALGGNCLAQSHEMPSADTASLDFKQFGLLAIQDNGRRKPIDTFAKETLIRITGRSSYTDKAGRKWSPNDFFLSALLETHDWKSEPMVLLSFGKLKEQLGLDKTQRRFSFAQLSVPRNCSASRTKRTRSSERRNRSTVCNRKRWA